MFDPSMPFRRQRSSLLPHAVPLPDRLSHQSGRLLHRAVASMRRSRRRESPIELAAEASGDPSPIPSRPSDVGLDVAIQAEQITGVVLALDP
jgi:hypothetical protein